MQTEDQKQAARAEFQARMGKPSHLRHFEKRALKAGENVVACVVGWTGDMMGPWKRRQKNGVLILTDQRVIFYLKMLLAEMCDAIPLERITSIDRRRGIHGQLIVRAAGAEIHFKSFFQGQLDALHAKLEPMAGMAPQKVAHVVPVGSIDQLERLAALRDAGHLTDAEFAAQKAKLLG